MAVYRVNKTKGFTVMANYHLQDITISLKAVGLLTKMLSFPDGWKFSTEGLAAICKEGPDAIQSALKELEQHGYLARHRLRDEKGRMTCTAFEIYEKPQAVAPHEENPHMENPIVDNPDVDNPPVENPRGENPGQSNTYKTNTKKSNTDSINHPSLGDGADEMKTRSELEDEIKANIDYDIIIENKQNDKRQIDEIVTLMLDAICSPSPTVRINGTYIPKTAVRERFLQLDSEHIEYVIFAMERSKPEIRNIRAYLLTALYNAPATMDSYYAALVSHDLNL